MLVVVPGHVILGLHQCCFSLLERSLHSVLELVDCLHLGFSLVRLKAHPRVSACVYHERSLLCRSVDMVVVLELSQWKEVIPVILVFIDKQA